MLGPVDYAIWFAALFADVWCAFCIVKRKALSQNFTIFLFFAAASLADSHNYLIGRTINKIPIEKNFLYKIIPPFTISKAREFLKEYDKIATAQRMAGDIRCSAAGTFKDGRTSTTMDGSTCC